MLRAAEQHRAHVARIADPLQAAALSQRRPHVPQGATTRRPRSERVVRRLHDRRAAARGGMGADLSQEDARDWMLPIEALAYGDHDPEYLDWVDSEEKRQGMIDELPIAAVLIYRFWQERNRPRLRQSCRASRAAARNLAQRPPAPALATRSLRAAARACSPALAASILAALLVQRHVDHLDAIRLAQIGVVVQVAAPGRSRTQRLQHQRDRPAEPPIRSAGRVATRQEYRTRPRIPVSRSMCRSRRPRRTTPPLAVWSLDGSSVTPLRLIEHGSTLGPGPRHRNRRTIRFVS